MRAETASGPVQVMDAVYAGRSNLERLERDLGLSTTELAHYLGVLEEWGLVAGDGRAVVPSMAGERWEELRSAYGNRGYTVWNSQYMGFAEARFALGITVAELRALIADGTLEPYLVREVEGERVLLERAVVGALERAPDGRYRAPGGRGAQQGFWERVRSLWSA